MPPGLVVTRRIAGSCEGESSKQTLCSKLASHGSPVCPPRTARIGLKLSASLPKWRNWLTGVEHSGYQMRPFSNSAAPVNERKSPHKTWGSLLASATPR